MFLGAPTRPRSLTYEERGRASTIQQMTESETNPQPKLNEKNHGAQSTGFARFKLQRRTRILLFRLLLLGVYTTSGAAIFHVLEADREDETNFCHTNGESKVEVNMAKKFNISMKEVRKIVEDLCDMFEASHKCKYSHNDWSYYQSLYFVGSVTTTIGYGHLAPKTQYGRLFLIFYAFFGIPINLLTLQSIGEHINLGFHYLITSVEKKLYKNNTVRHEHIKTFVLSIILMILFFPIGGIMYYFSEKDKGWSFLDSVYYCFVALSTIGFGDLVPNEGKAPKSTYEQVMWCVRLLFLGLGLSLVSSVFTSVSSATKQIQSAYMSKKGQYQINKRKSNKRRGTVKHAPCLNFRELLCNGNMEQPRDNTMASPSHEMYSRFEDTMSANTLTGAHINEGLSANSMELFDRDDNPNGRYRSISMALSQASLGTEYTLDSESCIVMADRTNGNNQLGKTANHSLKPKDGTDVFSERVLNNPDEDTTSDPVDRAVVVGSRDGVWTLNISSDDVTSVSNDNAIKHIER